MKGYQIRNSETKEFLNKFAKTENDLLYFEFTAQEVAKELDSLIEKRRTKKDEPTISKS